VTLSAQWPRFQDSGVPRDAQGRVRIEAPPPRTPDGKPDLAGNWLRADAEPLPSELAGLFGQTNRDPSGDVVGEPRIPLFPPDPKAPPIAAFWDLATNVPGGLPLTPWAAGVKKQRMAAEMKDNPDANYMPMGITQFHMQPQPWWYGYSVGRWEGDTLVVETNNLRGAEEGPFDGWLDVRGTPYTNQARFIERFRQPIFGKLGIDVTIEDAKAFTRPVTVRINQRVVVDEEPIEFVCNENQQFRQRIKIG